MTEDEIRRIAAHEAERAIVRAMLLLAGAGLVIWLLRKDKPD